MTIPRPNTAGRFTPDALFRPRSIAVFGGAGEAGAEMLANLTLGGFKGRLQTVHTPAAIETGTNLAVLAAAPDAIVPLLEALPARDCFAAIVPGAVEGGTAALAAAARRTGVRVLGPHSFGLAVPAIGLNATRTHLPPPAGRVALVSQSAALCRAVIDWAGPNGVGFSHIIGIGGNADIGFGLALDWLSRDRGRGTILLDIRRLKDHRVFLSAARAATRLRTVVAIRAGGRLADPSGAADLAFDAALRRAGVLAVPGLEDLLAAAETLSRARPARAETLAIVSNAIGPARLAADAALRHGLCLPADRSDGISVVPLDHRDRIADMVQAQATLPEVGGVLVVHAPSGAADRAALDRVAVMAKTLPIPLLLCVLGETTGALHRARLVADGLAVFAGPEQAVRGFAHLVQDRRNHAAARELPNSDVLALTPDRAAVRRLFDRVRASGRLALMQDEALEVLAAYGLPVLPGRVVMSAEDAAAAATLCGLPAVVKLRQHVSPCARAALGLMLDLHRAQDVAAAAGILLTRAARVGIGASLLVQRQAARARELAIRVFDDPTFGPVIRFGQGGTSPGEVRAAAMDLPPLNFALAHALIGRSQAGRLMSQAPRDRPPIQVAAVAEALARISQLVVDFPEIAILDAGSLFADEHGVVAADAWIALRPADAPKARLAIAPYPAELAQTWHSRGEVFTIRPIRPEDAAQHGAFFRRLSPEDIRYRFFGVMKELSAEQTARLTQVDYDREMAFIAVRATTGDRAHAATGDTIRAATGDTIRAAIGDTVGVSRLVIETDRRSSEFAVIVQADMKGRGLARLLMERLIDWARVQGVGEIVGQVLSDNAPMLAFVRKFGFDVRRMPDDPEVMEARLFIQDLADEAPHRA